MEWSMLYSTSIFTVSAGNKTFSMFVTAAFSLRPTWPYWLSLSLLVSCYLLVHKVLYNITELNVNNEYTGSFQFLIHAGLDIPKEQLCNTNVMTFQTNSSREGSTSVNYWHSPQCVYTSILQYYLAS